MRTSSALRYDSGGIKTQGDKSVQGRKGPIRSAGSNKNLSRYGLGPSFPKVIEDGVPHPWQQGKFRICACLRMANSKCLAPPPQILQPECRNLSGAQPVIGQQSQDCKVTQAFGGVIFARDF